MPYRCIASSPEGLVQQVAVSYLRHGYWWYVTGRIPDGKDAESVDRKLIAKYEIDQSDRQRAYRKKRGLANMQYIRYGSWFLPETPNTDPLGDEASLVGQNDVFSVLVSVAYSLRL